MPKAAGAGAFVSGVLGAALLAAAMLVGSFDGALTTEHAWRALGYLGLIYSF